MEGILHYFLLYLGSVHQIQLLFKPHDNSSDIYDVI